jgi:hypothetical protein
MRPRNDAVSAAISLVLGLRGVAIGHCHPKENPHAVPTRYLLRPQRP